MIWKYWHFISRLFVCMLKLIMVIIGLFSYIDITTDGWCHRNTRDKHRVREYPDDRNNWLTSYSIIFYEEVIHVILNNNLQKWNIKHKSAFLFFIFGIKWYCCLRCFETPPYCVLNHIEINNKIKFSFTFFLFSNNAAQELER